MCELSAEPQKGDLLFLAAGLTCSIVACCLMWTRKCAVKGIPRPDQTGSQSPICFGSPTLGLATTHKKQLQSLAANCFQ
jgi:hypothetical protein